MLGDGAVHVGGAATPLTGLPYFGIDIAKKIKLTADGAGAYILDAYGRVWNVGSAPQLTPNYTYHVGENWARDVELTDDEKGYYLLDKEGRIYTGGAAVAPTLNLTPVWPGEDAAIDLVVVESQAQDTMRITPDTVHVMAVPGQALSQTLQLSVADSTCQWVVSEDKNWLQVSPGAGSGSGNLTVTVQASQTGTFEGQVTVVDGKGVYDPVTIDVKLQVVNKVNKTFLPLVRR